MLDYPLPVPRDTHYDTLGLAPEATPEEVQEAARKLSGSLLKQKNELDRQIDEICAGMPGLKDARAEVDRLQESGGRPNPGALEKAKAKLARLERQMDARHPDLKAMRKRSEELQERVEAVNRMGLDSAEARTAYNRAHPPLELLEIELAAEDVLSADQFALPLLREALSRFLADQGESVWHPSDLTRYDFAEDFTYNALLDGEPVDGE